MQLLTGAEIFIFGRILVTRQFTTLFKGYEIGYPNLRTENSIALNTKHK